MSIPGVNTGRSEERRPSFWPWFVVLLLNLLTLAPSGIGRLLYDLSGRWLPAGLAWLYWLGLLVLLGTGLSVRKKSLRRVVLWVAVVLLLLNFGGCVAVMNELGSIT